MDDYGWQVLDLPGNPVPGDPDAIASLAVRLLTQGDQARERAERLLAVRDDNTGRMRGDYAARFTDVLAGLPSKSAALGSSYQRCGQVLDSFAEELTGIQQQAALILERGQQADEAYQRMAAQFRGAFPDVPFPEADEPGGIWRGMNAGWAEDAVRAYTPEFEMIEPPYQAEMMEEAGELGQFAEAAEAVRQDAIMAIRRLSQDYEDVASQCARAVQAAGRLPSDVEDNFALMKGAMGPPRPAAGKGLPAAKPGMSPAGGAGEDAAGDHDGQPAQRPPRAVVKMTKAGEVASVALERGDDLSDALRQGAEDTPHGREGSAVHTGHPVVSPAPADGVELPAAAEAALPLAALGLGLRRALRRWREMFAAEAAASPEEYARAPAPVPGEWR